MCSFKGYFKHECACQEDTQAQARYCRILPVPPLPKDSPNGCTTLDVCFLEFLGGSSNQYAVL